MEIQEWAFSSFWALTGVGSLYLGINAFDKTDLSNSISPQVVCLFKHFLAISACHSSTYALIFRPKRKIYVEKYYMYQFCSLLPILLNRIAGESFAWYIPIYCLVNLFVILRYFIPDMKAKYTTDILFPSTVWSIGIPLLPNLALFPILYLLTRGESFGWYFSIAISNIMTIFQLTFVSSFEGQIGPYFHIGSLSVLFVVGGKTNYFPVLVLIFGSLTAVAWAAISGDERFFKYKWLSEAASGENRILLKLKKTMKKNRKVIEFAIGMAGTVLFQSFFRLTSFDHVVAFLYLAVAWLANIAMLLARHDFGIFDFILTNVIVGCTVSQFGVEGTSWLAYGASLVLYILRLKLDALSIVNRGEDVVVVWREHV